MLPKPEKGRKKTEVDSSLQLDLLAPINHQAKIRKNRTWVIFLLIATIGPSLFFWIYRTVKFSTVTPRSLTAFLSWPIFTRSPRSDSDLAGLVTAVVARDPNFWSVFVLTLPESSSSFRWGLNTDALFSLKSQAALTTELRASSPLDTSRLLSRLPQGSQIRETTLADNGSYQLNSLITVPHKQILLLIKVSGSSDLTASQALIPVLAESVYWHLMSLD